MHISEFQPQNPDFAARVQRGFDTQAFLTYLGAKLTGIEAGFIEIQLPNRPELTQHHGFFHGGAVGALADVGGGFAAFSLMAVTNTVLTVEYKVNMMAPAVGEALVARGQVLRAGRQLFVATTNVFSLNDGVEKLVATSLGTYMMAEIAPETPIG